MNIIRIFIHVSHDAFFASLYGKYNNYGSLQRMFEQYCRYYPLDKSLL